MPKAKPKKPARKRRAPSFEFGAYMLVCPHTGEPKTDKGRLTLKLGRAAARAAAKEYDPPARVVRVKFRITVEDSR